MSHARQNVLAQILSYMANADNEQRSTKCGSCELSRLGSSNKKEREETKMTLYDELVARGLIAQVTDEALIKDLINNGKATFYIGFDPTADLSLIHISEPTRH